MMLRRFELTLDVWDTLTRERQEKIVDRSLANGAPLIGAAERDAIDLAAKDSDGQYVIAANAHSRLAHPDTNSGRRMLRRGLNYVHDEDGRRTSGLMCEAISVSKGRRPASPRRRGRQGLPRWAP